MAIGAIGRVRASNRKLDTQIKKAETKAAKKKELAKAKSERESKIKKLAALRKRA